jgi:predicted Zn-dependent protease
MHDTDRSDATPPSSAVGPHAARPAPTPSTLAEAMGITAEMGRFVADLAARELDAGGYEEAHAILEGLAISNPKDPAAWCLLALCERRRGRLLPARLCAEAAWKLAPDDLQVRLVRAEVLLAVPNERAAGQAELTALSAVHGHVGERARALLGALGVLPTS